MAVPDCRRMRLLCVDADEDARAILELALELDPDLDVLGVSSLTGAEAALSAGVPADGMVVAANDLALDSSSLGALRKSADRWNVPVILLFNQLSLEASLDQQFVDDVVIGSVVRPFNPLELAERVRWLLSSPTGSLTR